MIFWPVTILKETIKATLKMEVLKSTLCRSGDAILSELTWENDCIEFLVINYNKVRI